MCFLTPIVTYSMCVCRGGGEILSLCGQISASLQCVGLPKPVVLVTPDSSRQRALADP